MIRYLSNTDANEESFKQFPKSAVAALPPVRAPRARSPDAQAMAGRRIFFSYDWRSFRPFPPFALFAVFQDDAAVFGHARTAGFDTILLQQFRNHRIRRLLVTQRSDGVMEWLEIAEWDAMRIRPEFLNRLVQRFEIGRWL